MKKKLREIIRDLEQTRFKDFEGYELTLYKSFKDLKELAEEPPMNFGQALEALKSGEKITRLGWNGKGMFLYYVPPGKYPARTQVAKDWFADEGVVPYRAYIAMKTVDGEVVPWVASQSDILESDWVIVE